MATDRRMPTASAPTKAPRMLPRPPMTTTAKASTISSMPISLMAAVDEAEEPALHHDADQADREAPQGKRHDEERRRPSVPREVGDGRHARVRAQRIEGAAGQIEDLLNSEDDLQTGGDQEEDGGMEHTAHQHIDEVRRHASART